MSQIPSAQTTNSETPKILSRPNEARVATPDLDKLRTLVYGVTGTILDGVGRRYAIGSGSRLRITQVSFVVLWVDMLRITPLSAA
jgi:hypothetical protein